MQQIEQSRSRIFVVSLALGTHAGDTGIVVYQKIFDKGGVAVCIDSVHNKANRVLGEMAEESHGGILCVHPNYGTKNLNQDIPGSNIVTGIYGEQKDKIFSFLQRVMPEDSKQFSWIDLSEEEIDLGEGRILVGSELHDWALAYTQTLVHMVRLASPEGEFHQKFPNMTVSKDFSRRLIQANPEAVTLQKDHFDGVRDFSEALQKAQSLIQYIQRILGEKPYFNHLKTPNFKILEKMCQDTV